MVDIGAVALVYSACLYFVQKKDELEKFRNEIGKHFEK